MLLISWPNDASISSSANASRTSVLICFILHLFTLNKQWMSDYHFTNFLDLQGPPHHLSALCYRRVLLLWLIQPDQMHLALEHPFRDLCEMDTADIYGLVFFHAQGGELLLEVKTKRHAGFCLAPTDHFPFPFPLNHYLAFWSRLLDQERWCWVMAVWVLQWPKTTRASPPAGLKSFLFLAQDHRCELWPWPFTPPAQELSAWIAPHKSPICVNTLQRALGSLKPSL